MTYRKFINVRVWTHINISSSGHYFAEMSYTEVDRDGKIRRTWSRDYCVSDDIFLALSPYQDEWSAPKYVYEAVHSQLIDLHEKGKLKFFEYDRDKNKRYENLRYHEPEHWQWLVDHLKE